MSSPPLQFSAAHAANETTQQPLLLDSRLSHAADEIKSDADIENRHVKNNSELCDANLFDDAAGDNKATTAENSITVENNDGSKTTCFIATPDMFTETPKNDRERDNLHVFMLIMHDEYQRLLTFVEGGWPVKFISQESLASAGFFYLRNSDRVQCVFCKGLICDWEPGDVPLDEHKRHFPRCPFILGYTVGNVAIVKDPIKSSNRQQHSQTTDICGGHPPHSSNDYNGDLQRPLAREEPFLRTYALPLKSFARPVSSAKYQGQCVEEFGVILHKGAVNSNYVSRDSRTSSFASHSASALKSSVILGSQKIAEAGFYYCGFGNNVKCFFCGVTVRDEDLLVSSDPWVAHAIRSPQCNFLLTNKGIRFVRSAERERDDAACEASVSKSIKSSQGAAKALRLQYSYSELDLAAVFAQNTLCEKETQVQDECSQSTKCLENEDEIHTVHRDNEKRKSCESIHVCESDCTTETVSCVASLTASNEDEPLATGSDVEQQLVNNLSNKDLKPSAGNGQTVALLENDTLLCKTCYDGEIGVAFLPCGHVACTQCAPALTLCPVCRSRIKGTVRTYFE